MSASSARPRINSHCGAMSGKKPKCRNGVSEALKRTSPRASTHSRGTGRCWTQRPPPSSSEPGTKVASGSHSARRRRPHRLRLGADDGDRAVALEFAPVAAVDQAVIVPRLGDDRDQVAHAARTAGTPIVARARGPATILAPAARTCVEGHRIELRDDFGGLDQPPMHRQLPRDIARLAPRRLERHQQRRARLGLGPVELALGGVLGGGVDDLLDQLRRLARLPLGGRRIGVEQAGVGERVERRVDRVGQAAVLAQLPGTAATTCRRRPGRRTAARRNNRARGRAGASNAMVRCACSLGARPSRDPPVKRAGSGGATAPVPTSAKCVSASATSASCSSLPARPGSDCRRDIARSATSSRSARVIRAMLAVSPRIDRPDRLARRTPRSTDRRR